MGSDQEKEKEMEQAKTTVTLVADHYTSDDDGVTLNVFPFCGLTHIVNTDIDLGISYRWVINRSGKVISHKIEYID